MKRAVYPLRPSTPRLPASRGLTLSRVTRLVRQADALDCRPNRKCIRPVTLPGVGRTNTTYFENTASGEKDPVPGANPDRSFVWPTNKYSFRSNARPSGHHGAQDCPKIHSISPLFQFALFHSQGNFPSSISPGQTRTDLGNQLLCPTWTNKIESAACSGSSIGSSDWERAAVSNRRCFVITR